MKRVLPFVFLLAAPGAANAAPPSGDPTAAQTLFYEARALMQKGNFADACPKLEESMRLDAGIGTHYNLADCNEHIGKIATAWEGFRHVAADARAANQPERENVATKRAQALESRLPKLVIDVTGAPAGITVERDGIAVESSAFGAEIPVDPGVHHITATAPGRQTWATTVSTSEARTTHVAVPAELPGGVAVTAAQLPSPSPSPSPPPSPVPGAPPERDTPGVTPPATDFPPPVVERSASVQRTIGWVVLGAGVVGVGVGAGFGLSSIGNRDESRMHCVVDACDAQGVKLRDDALRDGTVATVAMIAGGVGVIGGLLLVLTAPKGTESPDRIGKRIRAVPNVARGGAGLVVQGSFW